jgi:hypothetical protein
VIQTIVPCFVNILCDVGYDAALFCTEVAPSSLSSHFSPDVKALERDRGLLPIDTTSSQAHEVYSEPKTVDHCTEHLSQIADLEERVKVLKQQITAAMEQAKKSAALSQKVS